MSDVLLGLMIPLGRRWKSYSLPSTTTVCPALLPPYKSKQHVVESGLWWQFNKITAWCYYHHRTDDIKTCPFPWGADKPPSSPPIHCYFNRLGWFASTLCPPRPPPKAWPSHISSQPENVTSLQYGGWGFQALRTQGAGPVSGASNNTATVGRAHRVSWCCSDLRFLTGGAYVSHCKWTEPDLSVNLGS